MATLTEECEFSGCSRAGSTYAYSSPGPVYAVYAISSLDTDLSLRYAMWGFVGTQQGVAGLTPRPFTLEEETGSHNGHGHVHRTRLFVPCLP